jgi:hypothetical protein
MNRKRSILLLGLIISALLLPAVVMAQTIVIFVPPYQDDTTNVGPVITLCRDAIPPPDDQTPPPDDQNPLRDGLQITGPVIQFGREGNAPIISLPAVQVPPNPC